MLIAARAVVTMNMQNHWPVRLPNIQEDLEITEPRYFPSLSRSHAGFYFDGYMWASFNAILFYPVKAYLFTLSCECIRLTKRAQLFTADQKKDIPVSRDLKILNL